MIHPSQRLSQLDEGVFQELALEKRRLLAEGREVIDLSVGSPDLPPPRHVVKALQEGVQNPAAYGYTITGLPEFQQAVALFYRRYNVTLNPESDVLQLMGSQDGLAHLALALINPGDTVLLPDPGYPIYEGGVRLSGGIPYPIPIDETTLHPNFDLIPKEILERAKLMILNYPSNPTAGVATREMFERVIHVAREYDIFIVHDFAYSEMIYDDQRAVSILSLPGASEVAVEFNSLSKTFNMAGCRIGYVVGNSTVIGHLRKLKSHIDYGIFLPIQRAAIAALTTEWDGLLSQRAEYTLRRDALCESLVQYGWQVRKPAATMFVWASTPSGAKSYQFALDLIRHAGVAVTPGAAFGPRGEGHVRMAIVHVRDTLVEAADRIGKFLSTYGN
ncbi:aminotransferase class I/II-fold pyridoxal phosphate-dependent enzyme [Alicyclobacillus fastidiosus]|uniref:Aminotransferase n=1 Tax=Alicyclobacillus fastidiosus TaxID=392011 RepID=A0ABY6ZGB5_9BACL|nr:aminotransferase class I/II-fold pyridoxal phosphate-dependent enzyme [Alicyclobacillus fastidiosus]WAH41628.1 aminotransferase class I/II-fold pyridoxal phosphate-dependent enzyme [Alicyclobacillus fastidiosus]GMA63295.1 aminotransferase [Alicyclobacillus fastidiosus]